MTATGVRAGHCPATEAAALGAANLGCSQLLARPHPAFRRHSHKIDYQLEVPDALEMLFA